MVRIWVIPLQQQRPMGFTFRQTDTYEDVIVALANNHLFNAIQVWDPWTGDYLVHVGPPIVSGSALMDCFTFKAMSGPYEPDAKRAALVTTSDQGVGTHAPIIYFVDNSLVYNIYNDAPEPETEHDTQSSAALSHGLMLHSISTGLLVMFPHWFATVIQRAFRRHRAQSTIAQEEDNGISSSAASENVYV